MQSFKEFCQAHRHVPLEVLRGIWIDIKNLHIDSIQEEISYLECMMRQHQQSRDEVFGGERST